MRIIGESKLRKRVSEYEKRLEIGYVSRRLFREGADPTHFLTEEYLLKKEQPDKRPDLLLILGNAGSGKSFILYWTFVQGVEKYLRGESSERPILLDCHKPLGDQSSIEDIIRADYGDFPSGIEHILLVDEVDEAIRQKGEGIVRDLGVFFGDHKDSITRIILTCRRPYWRDDWFSPLGFSDEDKVMKFNADYLERDVYKQLITDDVLREEFFRVAQERGIDELLDHPFEGFFLARRFVKGEELPDSRFKCFDLQIDECLKGTQKDKEKPSSPIKLMRNWASRLAATTALSGVDSWDLQQALDYLNPDGSIDPDKIADFLDRPLFYCLDQRYTFSHQLYSEFLVAEALKDQPIRKQRMLLTSDALGTSRIVPELRGVAMFLYSSSNPFASWLRENDPLVAFMGEPVDLSQEQKEDVLRNTIDYFITERRAPWHDIPPHGKELRRYLVHHVPRDIASFLFPYLESESELSRFWGAFCAEIWGGDKNLNAALVKIAFDPDQPRGLQIHAINAVAATEDTESLRSLYPLMESDDDSLRAKALRIYMELEKPRPSTFLPMLSGIKLQANLYGTIELVALEYAKSLDREFLSEAFDVFLEHHDKFMYIVRDYLFKGLLERSEELRFEDIPVGLFIRNWRNRSLSSLNDRIVDFLKPRVELKHRLWKSLLIEDLKEYNCFDGQTSRQLGLIAGEEFLDWIPDTISPLTDSRYWFVDYVLSSIYNKPETTKEIKECMKKRFPQHFPEQTPPLTEPEPKKPSIDEITRKINRATKEKKGDPALAVIEVLEELGFRDFAGPEEIDKVNDLINNIPLDLKQRVIDCFRNLVGKTEYKGERTARGWRMTHYAYSVPFWVLYRTGEELTPPKISEFLLCYGFHFDLEEMHKDLLDELRKSHKELWEQTVIKMMDDESYRSRKVLEYLRRCDSDIYLEQCGHRLRDCCSLSRFSLGDCLEYWKHFRERIPAEEYRQVLWECYQCLIELTKGKKESDRRDNDPFPYIVQFAPLFMLLANDDCDAWNELAWRVQKEDVPIGDIQSVMVGLGFEVPNNPDRMPVLADWYALCRRKEKDAMSRPLRFAILRVGGFPAIQRLRELQTDQAYPDAEWDSPLIFTLEEGMLSRSKLQHSPNEILEMLKENKYVVKTEYGLWEAINEALEEIQRSYQQGGYSTNPYWKGRAPKLEPRCHEILWPLLKEKLDRLGVSQVEERLIRPNILDFQVEKPIEGNLENLKVCIELKVARKDYGEARLVGPIKHQLWEKYMSPEQCQHGIYIVLWFRTEEHPYPKAFETPGDLLVDLQAKCHELRNRERIQIEPYVIDMTSRKN